MNIDYMIVVLRMLVLVFSFYGYITFVRKKVKLEFSIALVFTSIGSVMFLAGILNLMPAASFVILIAGVLLGLFSIKNKEPLTNVISVGTVFFGVMSAFLFVLLYQDKFITYDNFSHWAVVVKALISRNRFPNFTDTGYIAFTSYPPGSAAFIYYIVKACGISPEWLQMYAQAILMVGMLVCLFAFARKPKSQILAIIVSVMLLCSNTALYDLTVDTLLPLVALGGISLCVYYRDSLRQKTWAILPFTSFLVCVKNSGIFFVAAILLYVFIHLEKTREGVKAAAIHLAHPVIFLVLWGKHVSLVYQDGMASKHSLSLANYQNILSRKSGDDLKAISMSILEKTFSLSNTIIYLLIFIALLLLAQKYFCRKDCKIASHAGLLAILSYAGYQIGMLGMYLFSMPLNEAVILAGYDRYHRTILMFVTGVISIAVTSMIDNLDNSLLKKNQLVSAFLALSCVITSYSTLAPISAHYRKQTVAENRLAYDQFIQECSLPRNSSYMVVVTESQGYYGFLTRYLLLPESSITYDAAKNMEQISTQWKDYRYLVTYQSTDELLEWERETFGVEDNVIDLSKYR